MCRLFGMVTGPRPARATFWLIDAPDSLTAQSHAQPDGTGLGWYDDDGIPWVDKAAIAAREDATFALEAREISAANFLAHVRFASTGGLRPENTHPFVQDGRMLGHNGVIEGLDLLDAELGDYRSWVGGDTDSERFFALVTKQIDAHDGDVGASLAAAARWVARELPLYSLNVDHTSSTGRIHVRCGDLAEAPAVIFATEPMDDDPGWRNLQPGELVHVDAQLNVTTELAIPDPPAHPLTLAELHPRAAESQTHV